jgi:hypothetical protein
MVIWMFWAGLYLDGSRSLSRSKTFGKLDGGWLRMFQESRVGGRVHIFYTLGHTY